MSASELLTLLFTTGYRWFCIRPMLDDLFLTFYIDDIALSKSSFSSLFFFSELWLMLLLLALCPSIDDSRTFCNSRSIESEKEFFFSGCLNCCVAYKYGFLNESYLYTLFELGLIGPENL